MHHLLSLAAGLALFASLSACVQGTGAHQGEVAALPADPADPEGYLPLAGYGAMSIPADNPLTAEAAALGKQLYYDYRLSGDGSRSCYSCHVCENGLSDGLPTAIGAYEKQLSRNSPTLWNIGFHSEFYWDGRANSLEKQAFAAWKGGNMGASEPQLVVDLINGIEGYRAQFQAVFQEDASADNIPAALASYLRTIVGGQTAWDAWRAGDEDALSAAAKRGFEVFNRSRCSLCHVGTLFSDQQFHNVGIGMDADTPDVGRFKVTQLPQHMGAFKTPTLRDVSQSGPYFHDGSVATLEQAVRLMLGGGIENPNKDSGIMPAQASEADVADLLAFLSALDEPCDPAMPSLP
jgi:cytochrome c peroxidase